jgi:hypothetical protein
MPVACAGMWRPASGSTGISWASSGSSGHRPSISTGPGALHGTFSARHCLPADWASFQCLLHDFLLGASAANGCSCLWNNTRDVWHCCMKCSMRAQAFQGCNLVAVSLTLAANMVHAANICYMHASIALKLQP